MAMKATTREARIMVVSMAEAMETQAISRTTKNVFVPRATPTDGTTRQTARMMHKTDDEGEGQIHQQAKTRWTATARRRYACSQARLPTVHTLLHASLRAIVTRETTETNARTKGKGRACVEERKKKRREGKCGQTHRDRREVQMTKTMKGAGDAGVIATLSLK